LPGKKLAGLLTYLACTSPQPQRRETLTALLWGSHFDAQAKQNLRQALFRLRKVCGHDVLQGDSEFVSLNETFVVSDVSRFEALLRDGSRAALGAAATLYRGRLVDDVVIAEEGWDEWLASERERLLHLALGAMLKLGEHEFAAGHAEKALQAAQRAVALNNMREDAHRLIIRSLAAAGRRAEALTHYRNLVALLKRELNAEPDAATRSLAVELRSAEPPTVQEITEFRLDVSQDARPAPSAEKSVAPDHTTSLSPPAHFAGPERRQLTIMACTIAGPSAATALDPEDLSDLVRAFRKTVADAVARFNGFVAQYLTDGLIVYFGYPAAAEHDAEQAVRAGLDVINLVGALKIGFASPPRASVGIATGLVVVGERMGNGQIAQLVAVGEAANLAVKLPAMAAPGSVVIAGSTRRLVGGTFDCRALAVDESHGLPESVEAWEVRGEIAGVSRFEARRAGTLSPLIGRQEEVDRLRRRWDQARLGEGQVVLLSGEPGIGKSRMAENLLGGFKDELVARVRYFCSPHHVHSPLFPFITQLEGAVGFEPSSGAGEKLDKLEALLKLTSRNLPLDLPLIAELLGVPLDARYPALAVSSQQKRELTLATLLAQLDGMTAQRPVLIGFEDVHWIDPTSLDLLDRMVARAADLRVMLVVTFRPEWQPSWVGQPNVTVISLSRLGRQDSAEIIGSVAKGKPLPDVVVERVLARTDGVPLFIEEVTSSMLESGVLRETADGYAIDAPLPERAIPMTLRASLTARLDRLGPIKQVAQIGAAIGREFSHELIGAVASSTQADLDAALERLTESGLLSRHGTPPIATYSFKHALVQDAAYATMLKSRQRPLHARIAHVLVDRFPAMAENLPEVVARHFTDAGLASEAIGYWRKAGQLADTRSAAPEAVSSFERALSLLEAMPESTFTLEQSFDIRLELRSSLQLLGEGRRVLERLREAEALAERLNDDCRRGQVCELMTTAHLLVGEMDEAVAAGIRTLEIARRLGDVKLRVLSTNSIEQVHYYRGEYGRVVELATGNLAAQPGAKWTHAYSPTPPPLHDRCWLGMSLAQLGRFAEATENEAKAIQLAESMRHPYAIAVVHRAAGTHHLIKGDWTRARSSIEQGIEVARAGSVVILLPSLVASSAWVLSELGDGSEALDRLREGEELVERHAARGIVSGEYYHALGRACLLLGRLDEALRLADRAIEASPRHPGFAAHALHLFGDIATDPGLFDAERGEAYYRQALALAEPRSMRPLVAHCRLGLGKVYLRTGDPVQARDHLTAAATMYREMGLRFWLEQAEVELANHNRQRT